MENLVDARKLKDILLEKSDFSLWMKRRIDKNKLVKNKDFFDNNKLIERNKRKINKNNYLLTIEASKKIIQNSTRNKRAQRILNLLSKGDKLEIILEKLKSEKESQMRVIKYKDDEYPEQLKIIKKPPEKLYVKGDIEILKEEGIAVIGTRHATLYGRRMCKIFTNNLVGYNLNIISGLATGIDACAHKACIEAKGKTIAVLPSGFNNIFPEENEELLNTILENGGTVITEYPPDFEKTSESCRERNRIIAGLAIGTLVVEAGKYSGTGITVRNTKEQVKKVFCVPGSLLSAKGVGTNEMIKKGDAKLVTEVEDIIKEFPELKKNADFSFKKIEYNKKPNSNKTKKEMIVEIEEENLEIYKCLSEVPKSIEEIAEELEKTIKEISYKLTLLELQGVIEELPGKKFKKKGR